MAPETRHDLTRLLVASQVAKKKNNTRPLIRTVGVLGARVSDPGSLVRSKLSKKKQGRVYRSCC